MTKVMRHAHIFGKTTYSRPSTTNQSTSMDQAKAIIQANSQPKWKTDATFKEVCLAVSRSFTGSETTPSEPITSWVFRGVFPRVGKPDRFECYMYLMAFVIDENLRKGGIAFGHQQDDGTLQSCTIIRECNPAIEFSGEHCSESSSSETGFVEEDIPSTLTDETMMEMFEEQEKILSVQLHEIHKRFGPKGKHIYVFNVATNPACQGRGYGRQLMTQINEISDASGLPCFLECAGDKNRSFYEKFGYRAVKSSLLDKRDKAELFIECMIREPEM